MGISTESCALQAYQARQRENGHPELVVDKSGFIISPYILFLELTLIVLSSPDKPYRFLEIMCPYLQQNVTPIKACDSPGFCFCTLIIGDKPSI